MSLSPLQKALQGLGVLPDRRDKMVSRVYKGIPDSMRGAAWKLLLDIDRKKEEQRGRYKVRQMQGWAKKKQVAE